MPTRTYEVRRRGSNDVATYAAATAGKARYLAILDLRDSFPDISFSDLSVRSLGIRETVQEKAERQAREWNAAHGPGTPIRVYPVLADDEATAYDTVAAEPGAYVLGGHSAVVKVPGDAILLSHITVLSAEGGAE